MQFHEKCGKSIVFSDANKSAERKSGYCDGIVYSLNPLSVTKSQIFQVRIEATEDKWAGSIRLGVTTLNPEEVPYFRTATDIHHSLKHGKMFWICCGSKLFHENEENEISSNLYKLSGINNVIGIQLRPNGQLHTYRNGRHVEKVASGLPTGNKAFFVFIDIYGCVKKVSCIGEEVLTLKDISRRAIYHFIQEEDVDKLDIPNSLKDYLKA